MNKEHNTQKQKIDAIIDSSITIVLGLLTIASIFFFIIPNINEYFEVKKQVDEQKLLVKKLKTKINDMNNYSTQELDELYQQSLKYLPENINIAEMGSRINNIANQFNLHIERLTLSETTQNRPIKVSGHEKDLLTLPLKSITAPFLMTGNKNDLLSFLDLLTGSLEAREFTTVQLINSKDKLWSLRLTLTHLYMPYIHEIPISPDLPNLNKAMLEAIKNQDTELQSKNNSIQANQINTK